MGLDRLDGREEEGQIWFKRLQGAPYKGTYSAAIGLYRQAVTTFNNTQDPRKAIPIYLQMISDYPQHPETEHAYMYLCLDYLLIKDVDKAQQTLTALIQAFPKTACERYLKKHIADAQAQDTKEK